MDGPHSPSVCAWGWTGPTLLQCVRGDGRAPLSFSVCVGMDGPRSASVCAWGWTGPTLRVLLPAPAEGSQPSPDTRSCPRSPPASPLQPWSSSPA
uniref:Uncharacterized protein n=1 Tax=Knipowitschia caucasica TaxID=637954 RepID=A0AAV2JL47_KNICA